MCLYYEMPFVMLLEEIQGPESPEEKDSRHHEPMPPAPSPPPAPIRPTKWINPGKQKEDLLGQASSQHGGSSTSLASTKVCSSMDENDGPGEGCTNAKDKSHSNRCPTFVQHFSEISSTLEFRLLPTDYDHKSRRPSCRYLMTDYESSDYESPAIQSNNKKVLMILSEVSEEGFQIPATITERYKVGRTIGDGNFAVVKECVESQQLLSSELEIQENKKRAKDVANGTHCLRVHSAVFGMMNMYDQGTYKPEDVYSKGAASSSKHKQAETHQNKLRPEGHQNGSPPPRKSSEFPITSTKRLRVYSLKAFLSELGFGGCPAQQSSRVREHQMANMGNHQAKKPLSLLTSTALSITLFVEVVKGMPAFIFDPHKPLFSLSGPAWVAVQWSRFPAVQWDISTAREYALKIIKKSKCRGKEHMIQNEVSILRRVKHPNIVLLIEEMDVPTELYLVMELVKLENIVIGYSAFCISCEHRRRSLRLVGIPTLLTFESYPKKAVEDLHSPALGPSILLQDHTLRFNLTQNALRPALEASQGREGQSRA
ncbi:hypothetical protein P7K49_012450 [Saguinus oedipus]|uniref:Protein kinase domain-containing protein n=1 Tax=Saguinus oedipus TaxID=9490 RepID=A0ABQ9VVX0_SAGOE|nr:hypothetical protein P7K49_012450 [Saguinus oedipus]